MTKYYRIKHHNTVRFKFCSILFTILLEFSSLVKLIYPGFHIVNPRQLAGASNSLWDKCSRQFWIVEQIDNIEFLLVIFMFIFTYMSRFNNMFIILYLNILDVILIYQCILVYLYSKLFSSRLHYHKKHLSIKSMDNIICIINNVM